ncbi:MAG TPA: EscU/YscU/HrcU family type III secretion system export apparatus switch protein, partial [Pyrinomonadaceae bacterium]
MSDNRTEKPTPRRREEARKKGQVARRPELAAIASFIAALVMLRFTSGDLLARAARLFESPTSYITTKEAFGIPLIQTMFVNAATTLALLSLPVIAAALTAGLAANFAQGGLTFAVKALAPNTQKFNPVSNVKKIFGSNGPIELIKSFLKLGGLALVCWGTLVQAITDAPRLVGAPSASTFSSVGQIVYSLGLRAGGVLFAVAALDYGWGWYKHEKSLRMSRQELKEEYRRQEGDPMVKSQRRRAARALAQRRIASEVPKADVVVTNPTHFAVALRYDRTKDAAPIVVAKGADLLAKRIREIAKENKVPIVENP